MKNIFFLSLVALAIIFTVYSCKKTVNNVADNNARIKGNTVMYTIGTGNDLNNLGSIHNDCLDDITLDAGFPNLSEEDEFDIIEIRVDNDLPSVEIVVYDDISTGVSHVTASIDNRLDLPQDMLDDERITQDVKDYLDDIYNAAGFIANQTQSGVKGVQDVIDDIEDIEQDIITDFGNPNTDPDADIDGDSDEGKSTYLLGVCAIVKYSYAYWETVRDDVNHDWYDEVYPPGSDDTGKKFWETKFGKFLTKCWNDVCGFVGEAVDADYDVIEGKFTNVKIKIGKGLKGAAKSSSK